MALKSMTAGFATKVMFACAIACACLIVPVWGTASNVCTAEGGEVEGVGVEGVGAAGRGRPWRLGVAKLMQGGVIWSEHITCKNIGDWSRRGHSPCRSTPASGAAGVLSVRVTDCAPAGDKLQCNWKVDRYSGLRVSGEVKLTGGAVKCSPHWRYNGRHGTVEGCLFQFSAAYVDEYIGSATAEDPGKGATVLEQVAGCIVGFLFAVGVVFVLTSGGGAMFLLVWGALLFMIGIAGGDSADGGSCTGGWDGD